MNERRYCSKFAARRDTVIGRGTDGDRGSKLVRSFSLFCAGRRITRVGLSRLTLIFLDPRFPFVSPPPPPLSRIMFWNAFVHRTPPLFLFVSLPLSLSLSLPLSLPLYPSLPLCLSVSLSFFRSFSRQTQYPTRAMAPAVTRGGSGLFGSSWGSNGPPPADNNNDDHKRRVDTRGPPDLNAPLPPTAPGARNPNYGTGNPSGSGPSSGSGGLGVGRERIKTVGPPDAAPPGGSNRRTGRGRLFSPSAGSSNARRDVGAGRWGAGNSGSASPPAMGGGR